MDLKTYNELIQQIEKGFPVEKWRYNDMDIWPIFRCSFKPQAFSNIKEPFLNKVIKVIWRVFLSAFYNFKSLGKAVEKSDILFINTSVNYRFKYKNELFDYYLDPIAKELSEKNISTAAIGIYSEDRYKKLPEHIYFNDFIRYFYFMFPVDESKLILPEFEKFKVFCERKNLNFNWKSIIKKIGAEYRYSFRVQKILKKVAPRLVLVSCYAGKWGMILASKRESVPFVDIQHGVQGNYHYEYNHWENLHNTLPDIFWVWSEADKGQIKSWGGEVFLGGHPLFRAMQKNLVSFQDKASSRKGILFSLQHGFDWSFIKEIISSLEYPFYIRFHPMSPQADIDQVTSYLRTVGKEIDWKWATEEALPVVLEKVGLHITLSSSVVIEASYMGINSICTSPDIEGMYPDLISSGMVKYFPSEQITKEVIDNLFSLDNKLSLAVYNEIEKLLDY